MTQRSELGNKTPYKIIDNEVLAAQRLADYMMKPSTMTEARAFVNATVSGGAEYTNPLHSIVWYPIYMWTRRREESLNKLVSSLNMISKDDRKLRMRTFINWMDDPEGTWYEGSLNTDIMYELLKLLPQYKKTDPDPRKTFDWSNMANFYALFKERAETMLAAMREDNPAAAKQLQEEALSQLPSTKDLKQRLFAEANKPIPRTVVVNIPEVNQKERTKLKQELLDYLRNPKTPESIATAEPVSRTIAPIEEIVLQQAAEQPAVDEVETPIVAPPAPPPLPSPFQFRK